MAPAASDVHPLVSIIIPSYNYGHFLAEAIESVLQQTYPAIEIVVVDDGSTDSTPAVAARYPSVVYIYQQNQGLSAARNTGIHHSRGEYLVFLDADDWLLPNALMCNAVCLGKNPQAAFVSGGHVLVITDTGKQYERRPVISSSPYLHLLSNGNYISMIAAVMFARWVFTKFRYDASLTNCEDYDIYFNITHSYPIVQHTELIAAYRIHAAAMSAQAPAMLVGALKVLNRQLPKLRRAEQIEAYYQGVHFWTSYYQGEDLSYVLPHKLPGFWKTTTFFLAQSPQAELRYLFKYTGITIKTTMIHLLRPVGKRLLHTLGLLNAQTPAVGNVSAGDFARSTPFSSDFGYDRGGPIDRYYIENFLQQEAASVKGRALEIGDNAYTMQYGGEKITKSDILHIDDSNASATFVGDLSNAPHLPDNTFDCIVLTQTLHLIYDFKQALITCQRILKPGGVLLLTVPGISPIDRGEWGKTWYWSFTRQALELVFAETFPHDSVEIGSYGNVFVASAYLYGMGVSEVTKKQLDFYDPQFQVINTVKATKTSTID